MLSWRSPRSLFPMLIPFPLTLQYKHASTMPRGCFSDVPLNALNQRTVHANGATSLHLSSLPRTTRYYRLRGRPNRRENAIKQQYLSPREEKALVRFLLHLSNSNFPVPVKLLRPLARVIRRQRSSLPQSTASEDDIPLPGKNWPQGFYKRHPELRARRRKPIAWSRHDINIRAKVEEWFTLIGRELDQSMILPKNVYNTDETGVMLNDPKSLKVLVGTDDLRTYRGAGVSANFDHCD